MDKFSFEIKSLNGVSYIYNYKYNTLLNKELYCQEQIEELAKKNSTCEIDMVN